MVTSTLQLTFRATRLSQYAGKPVTLAIAFASTDESPGDEGTIAGVPVNAKGVYSFTIYDVHYYTNGKPGQFHLQLREGIDAGSPVVIDDDGNAVEDVIGIP